MAGKPEAHQEIFTEKQLDAVTKLNVVDATDNVDLVVAKNVGLITEETRLKIESTLADHNVLFKAAKERILRANGPAVKEAATPPEKNAVAIRLAFEQIYGKFLFEEEYSHSDPQHEFAHQFEHKLHHLLKVEIKEEDGIKGRSDLLAARRRLMMLNARESTDPAKAAEIAANRTRIEGEISKIEKAIELFEKIKTASDKGENYTMIFKTIPKFLELIINNKGDYEAAFVTKCENYRTAFEVFLSAKGFDAKSKKSQIATNPTFFTDLKTAHFDDFAKDLAPFADENIPKLKAELTKKEEELGMANFPTAAEVLKEAFTVTKPLTPAEIDTKFKEAQTALESITPIASPNPGHGEIDKVKKLLTNSSNKSDINKAIEILQNIHGFFDDKKDQDRISLVIDNLEQIAGISPEVLIERATTKKEKAESKVQKTKSVKEYFEKNKATDISGKDDGLVKMTLKKGKKIKIKNAEDKNVDLDGVNFAETIVELTSFVASQASIQNNNQDKGDAAAERKRIAGAKKAAAEKAIDTVKKLQTQAKEFYDVLLAFAENAAFLAKNGFLDKSYKPAEIEKIASELKGMDPMVANVSVQDLHAKYTALDTGLWFRIFKDKSLENKFSTKIATYNQAVKDADKDLKKKTENLHAVHDLSDTAAAKRIIFAVVKRQHPELSLEEQYNLANLILADDVERIQTSKSYEDLAKEGSENLGQLIDSVGEHDFRWKVLKFRYQVDGKIYEPFKGLKPGDLNNWEKIEKQFSVTGKFDYQIGLYFLAAIVERFGDKKGPFTDVYTKLEKKIKGVMIRGVGMGNRTGEPSIRRIIDDEFNAKLKECREMMKGHFDHYDKNKGDINKAKVKELQHKLKELDEKRKLGKLDQEQYEEKYEKLVKEAREYGVEQEMEFAQDVTLNGYLNGPEAQWLKDLGMDVGRWGKDKAWALVKGTAMTGVNAAVGTVKVGASLALQGLATPFRLAKYPVLLVARPVAGFINLFRTNKLNTPGIIETVKTDVGRVGTYFKTIGTESFEGAKKKTAESYGKPWSEAQYKSVKYGDRTKFKPEEEAARIKELADKADLKPIEVAHDPSAIDFNKLAEKIKAADALSSGGHEAAKTDAAGTTAADHGPSHSATSTASVPVPKLKGTPVPSDHGSSTPAAAPTTNAAAPDPHHGAHP